MRLAVVITHPIQYFAPVFRGLAREKNVKLRVFFGCDHGAISATDPNFGIAFKWDSDIVSGYEHRFLSKTPPESLKGISGATLGLKAALEINRFRPDAVLIVSCLPAFITTTAFFLFLAGHRLLLRAETSDRALCRSGIKTVLRRFLLNLYYRQFSHLFPIGTDSVEHYRKAGVREERLSVVHYAVDADYFENQAKQWLPARESLRASAGIPPAAHVLLYCGKIFAPKNPLLIPQALAHIPKEQRERLWLLVVGEGRMREEFEKQAGELLDGKALFVGFKNQSELGQYYAMADTLILPSRSGETWGLVVNEALQFGLRVLVSDKVGAARDIVRDQERGTVFASGDASALAAAIAVAMTKKRNLSPDAGELPHPAHLVAAVASTLRNMAQSRSRKGPP